MLIQLCVSQSALSQMLQTFRFRFSSYTANHVCTSYRDLHTIEMNLFSFRSFSWICGMEGFGMGWEGGGHGGNGEPHTNEIARSQNDNQILWILCYGRTARMPRVFAHNHQPIVVRLTEILILSYIVWLALELASDECMNGRGMARFGCVYRRN